MPQDNRKKNKSTQHRRVSSTPPLVIREGNRPRHLPRRSPIRSPRRSPRHSPRRSPRHSPRRTADTRVSPNVPDVRRQGNVPEMHRHRDTTKRKHKRGNVSSKR